MGGVGGGGVALYLGGAMSTDAGALDAGTLMINSILHMPCAAALEHGQVYFRAKVLYIESDYA